eukprot:5628713-Amphidinium_carterae.1
MATRHLSTSSLEVIIRGNIMAHRFKEDDAKIEELGKVNGKTATTCTLMLTITSEYEPFCQIICTLRAISAYTTSICQAADRSYMRAFKSELRACFSHSTALQVLGMADGQPKLNTTAALQANLLDLGINPLMVIWTCYMGQAICCSHHVPSENDSSERADQVGSSLPSESANPRYSVVYHTPNRLLRRCNSTRTSPCLPNTVCDTKYGQRACLFDCDAIQGRDTILRHSYVNIVFNSFVIDAHQNDLEGACWNGAALTPWPTMYCVITPLYMIGISVVAT